MAAIKLLTGRSHRKRRAIVQIESAPHNGFHPFERNSGGAHPGDEGAAEEMEDKNLVLGEALILVRA